MSKDNDYVLDDRARTALVASREEKWEGIRDGRVKDNNTNNCALCGEYYDAGCVGCPVFEETGRTGCRDTPYRKWEKHQDSHHSMCKEKIIHCQECADICDEEIAFLKELEAKFDKPKDVIVSFKNYAEYKAFYQMLLRNLLIPELVSKLSPNIDSDALQNLMTRITSEIDNKNTGKA